MSTFGPLPPLTRLYRACEPNDPVSPDDPRYVNCDEVRGDNLPLRYERSLRLSDPLRPEVKVFAGHRGVGKSSELLRLKEMLERPDAGEGKPYHVLFTDVTKSLDLNDLDFPDLLVFLPTEFWPHLQQFEVPRDDIPTDAMHQEMLFLLHVFGYMNGRPWYEVNPVLRTIPRFAA